MQLLWFFTLLMIGYFCGSYLERRHFARLAEGEAELKALPAVTMKHFPGVKEASGSGLVMGSAVVSIDYFKLILASLRMIFGGRLGAYETLLDRGRREALLRMKRQAKAQGFEAIINVRLETSRLAGSNANQRGISGVEVLAYGTGLRLGPADEI
ncbi:MAG TPA: hypothetical protein DCQ06_14200 [Myxococcales bacterium]|nr:hypothetical protein [Myxococcales bacterium]HAN32741.1 hypothetical protein [Myxococcales bacterium]